MKVNAIIRIIIWSIVIVLLLGSLVSVMAFWLYRSDTPTIIENIAVDHGELTIEEMEPAATVYIDRESDIMFDPTEVKEIEITWAAGSILIMPYDVAQIEVSESDVSDPKYAMECYLKSNKLIINFSEESKFNFGFGVAINDNLSKDLTILVPREWELDKLEIDAASAKVEVCDMTIRDVEFDTASGVCEFENCTVDTLDIDTASGDVTFVGSLNILDCDAASANIAAILSNTPNRMDLDTMSGNLDITLPADCGFTVSNDGLNSDFESDFPTTTKNRNHVYGDGRCRIDVDAMSGDVIIRKGE